MASIEPRTIHFDRLVYEQVLRGNWRAPRFQRAFVWRRDQILKLFDSIRLRYPIGSLLIWKTRKRYASFERVGPISVPLDQPREPTEVGYILDGHQRVSTLVGALALTDEQAETLKGPDRVFLVYYDLEKEKFLHPRFPQDHQLPVRYLLARDDDRFTTWLDERRDATVRGSPERERWDLLRRRATSLQTTFAQYQIPYLDVQDASLDEAVNIFTLLNLQGTVAKRSDVFAALSWKPDGFDFAQAAREILDSYPRYANFGTDPLLRALLASLGESVYAKDWQRVQQEHKNELRRALRDVKGAFGRATQFLDSDIGASSGKIVPYALQLVLLTEFFRLCPDPGRGAREQLTDWIWASALSGAYTTGGNRLFNTAIERARRLARGDDVQLLDDQPRLRPFPRHFHAKSARVRAVHLFLKTQKPLNLRTGEPIEGLLRNGMADARSVVDGRERKRWLAGRLLVGARASQLLADLRVAAQSPHRAEVLRSHVMTEQALEAILRGDQDEFLTLREAELIRREREFVGKYVDIGADGEDETLVEEEPEIDVEDASEPDFV